MFGWVLIVFCSYGLISAFAPALLCEQSCPNEICCASTETCCGLTCCGPGSLCCLGVDGKAGSCCPNQTQCNTLTGTCTHDAAKDSVAFDTSTTDSCGPTGIQCPDLQCCPIGDSCCGDLCCPAGETCCIDNFGVAVSCCSDQEQCFNDGTCGYAASSFVPLYIGVLIFIAAVICLGCCIFGILRRRQAFNLSASPDYPGGVNYGSINRSTAPKGVPAHLVLQLPTVTYSKDQFSEASCVICLADYMTGEVLRVLPCKHYFHFYCIDRWLKDHDTCPLCVQNVVKL